MNKKLIRSVCLLILYAALLILTAIKFDVCVSFLSGIIGVLSPFFIGTVIAFILNKPMVAFRKFFESLDAKSEKQHPTLVKLLSVLCAYLLLTVTAAVFILIVIPQLTESLILFYNNIRNYAVKANEFILKIDNALPDYISVSDSFYGFLSEKIVNIADYITDFLPSLLSVFGNLIKYIWKFILGLAVSVCILSNKEAIFKSLRRFFGKYMSEKTYNKQREIFRLTSNIFSQFVSGQFADAVIVGSFCLIGMSIFGFSYAPLISTVIAVTNVIPVFGPVIGAVPSVIILFFVDPAQALWFAVFIVVLQQIDGNFICPRIVGSSIGLPPLYVIIAITVGTGLFGVAGMFLGVPAFAVIYVLTGREIRNRI